MQSCDDEACLKELISSRPWRTPSLTRKVHFRRLSWFVVSFCALPSSLRRGLCYHRFILTSKYNFRQAGTEYISEHFAHYPLRRIVGASPLLSTSKYSLQSSDSGLIIITSVGRYVGLSLDAISGRLLRRTAYQDAYDLCYLLFDLAVSGPEFWRESGNNMLYESILQMWNNV
jgi:hypothetical protein